MSLGQCPECSSQVSSKALMCMSCGFPLSRSKALSVAILLKDSRLISNLIKQGADVNSADEYGRTPLMFALMTADKKIVDMLLNSGASAPEKISTSIRPAPSTEPEAKPSKRVSPIKVIDDEVAEKPENHDDLSCLQCGGSINADDVNCPHCKTLIMRRYCSHCSRLIPDHATICPLCHRNVKEHFLYAKLRRAKILLGIGAAAIFTLFLFILIWQHSATEKTAQADAIRNPETPSVETKSIAAEMKKDETKAPEQPKVQEIPRVPATTKPKLEPRHEAQKEPVESKIETPKSAPPELAKAEEPHPELPKVEKPPQREVELSAAAEREFELRSQQQIKKAKFLNDKGFTLIKGGRPSEAIPVLQKSLRSFPKGTRDVTYAYALFNLAVAYRLAGRPDIAIPILEQRIKINNQRDLVQRELITAKKQARLAGRSDSDLD